jgi:tRNA modification GTPase
VWSVGEKRRMGVSWSVFSAISVFMRIFRHGGRTIGNGRTSHLDGNGKCYTDGWRHISFSNLSELSMKRLTRTWSTRNVNLLARSRSSCALGHHDGLSCTRNISLNTRPRYDGRPLSKTTRGVQHRSLVTLRNSSDSTIYALSTAPGRGAIAIIRVSGPACLSIYRALCPGKNDPKPRYATVRTIYDPAAPPTSSSVLDSGALILYFPAPKTVTGEDLLELHVHGGTAIVRAVLAAIPKTIGSGSSQSIRYAEPGEFTRRAFANDRLDLTQVEALGDSLAASTEQQRRLSVRGTTNSLATRYESWRKLLLEARGELEALIDFSEDQHFDESINELLGSVATQVVSLRTALLAHRENAVRGELLRSGISLALLGAPNAGKSSLLNAVVGREAAIVSREAGTTRDVVEVGIDLGGFLCRLGDTAGLRKALEGMGGEAIGMVEQEGMKRAKARAEESDVVVVVLSFETGSSGSAIVQLDAEVIETAARLTREKDNVLVVINKTDMTQDNDQLEAAIAATQKSLPGLKRERIHPISCASSELKSATTDPGNVQSFLRALIAHFATLTSAISPESSGDADSDPSIWQESLGATERHRLLLEACIASLDDFTALVDAAAVAEGEDIGEDGEADVVLAAEHLRGAADSLARITGRGEAGDVEEVLGVVFEKFCVGK